MIKENEILIELLEGVENWSQLKVKLEKYNTSETETTTKKTQAGKIFELFTKYYLQTDPTKTDLYKNVWLYNEISLSIKEQLELPSIDHGIDLLLQDNDNEFHALQCKFKNDESKSLSWSGDKIANVFALGTNCKKIIVFTNASDTTEVAKAFEQKFEQIAFDELNLIEKDVFENILTLAKGNRPKELTKHSPREHQAEAIEKVVAHFETNSRGQLILPCGAGKTVTALWIKEQLIPQTTLVLVPSLALLKQIKNDWSRHKNHHFSYLCVCSEKDIDKDQVDSVRLHTYEIGGPVTTNVENVTAFLNKDGAKVIYSTYQSIEVVLNAISKIKNFVFDLVICDEAHRTAGSKDKNTFTLVHDPIKLPAQKRLYMTATPKVVSKKLKRKLGEDYDLLCDMSNPQIFGDEAYHMTFGDAIERKILVDYKIIGIGVTDKQVQKHIEERKYLGNFTAEELAHNYALDLVMKNYGAFHSISFHSKVEFARNFSKRHLDLFKNVFSSSVDGNQTTTYRAKILQAFKESPIGLVSNARCLTEGVDVPAIDLIYFCDPKSSVVDIVQASGRALRLDPTGKKQWGYIVVPIFHHEDEDVEAEIKKKPIFEHLIQVIRSLCDHDERLLAEINEIAFKKGKKGSARIKLDFAGSNIEKIIKLEGIEEKVKDVLFDEIIEKTSSNWEIRFLQIKEFIEKNGHSTISKKLTDLSELYHWVGNLRKSYHEGRLENSKIKRLNAIGFDWKGENRREINDLDELWRISYNKLKEYFEENGHSNVPARYDNDKPLGTWCVSQRVKFDEEKLASWQIELLENIQFNWDPKNIFEKHFHELQDFKIKFGHLKVPTQGNKLNPLGRWVNRLRTINNAGVFNDKGDIVAIGKGRIKAEQLKRLNEIGFVWNVRSDWNNRYKELLEFKAKFGHTDVKQNDDFSLYQWCYKQKKTKDTLANERLELLNEINFNFEFTSQFENLWDDKLFELMEYFDENDNYDIPRNNPKYRSLISWIKKQHNAKLNNELSSEQLKSFEEIGFSIDDFFKKDDLEVWMKNLEDLKQHQQNTGSFYIDPSDDSNKTLKNWIQYQRSLKKNNKLSDDKISMLMEIGYSFEVKYNGKRKRKAKNIDEIEPDNDWLQNLNQLKSYFESVKTFLIPSSNKELTSLRLWLRYQKTLFKNNSLGEKKIKRLNEIGYNFDENYRGKSLSSFTDEQNQTEEDNTTNVWLQRLKELKTYFDLNNSFYISNDDKENIGLLSWIRYQRILYRADKLEDFKINMLKEIGYSFELDFRSKQPDEVEIELEDWKTRLFQFKEYYDRTNTFFISGQDEENKDLLDWINYQRQLKRLNKLSNQKLELLDEIGFSFDINYYRRDKVKKEKVIKEKPNKTEIWDNLYLKLLNYKLLNGNCNVPRGYKEDTALANFVIRQRANFKNGTLSPDEIKKLELIQFEWEANREKGYLQIWNNNYLELKKFYDETKSNDYTKSNIAKSLYHWVLQQRMKKRNNELSNEQIKLLDDIKFSWNPEGQTGSPDDNRWLEMLGQLEDYKSKFGNCNVSQLDITYKKLGRWLNDQRVNLTRGKLFNYRKDLLDEIGVVWNVKEYEWSQKLDKLKAFYLKNGRFEIKKIDEEYDELYNWVFRIKKFGTTQDKIDRLCEIGFDVSDININEN